jgi:hypothetical protein
MGGETGANSVSSDMWKGRKGPGQKLAWFGFRSWTMRIMGWLLQAWILGWSQTADGERALEARSLNVT